MTCGKSKTSCSGSNFPPLKKGTKAKFATSCCNAFVTCIVQARAESDIYGQLAAVFWRITIHYMQDKQFIHRFTRKTKSLMSNQYNDRLRHPDFQSILSKY